VGAARELGLLFARLHANIENIASPKDDIAVVRRRRVASVFSSSIKDYVHVTVGINHPTAVFNIILETNTDLAIQFLH
jgi:hypothetical protein